MTIGHLCVTALTVHRPSTVADGIGGTTVTYSQVGQIRAQVNQPTPEERMLAQQAEANLTHILHTVAGADVRKGDELGGDLPTDVPAGRRLRVISAVSNSRTTYLRIEAETTQAEGA
ncbi:MAG TPA: head-tail adaptor protein [Acidimicrobiales bacterium]|nr:head-tail adaptor protein [Acidimicrobiales bacterium]